MASVLFIGEQYLKDFTPVSNNLDIEQVRPHIEFSQDSYVQDILGTNLYNDLQTKYSTQTLNAFETSLLLLIKPALAYRSTEASIPFINTQIRNKGLNLMNSENAIQAEIDRMRYLREECRNRAEFYEERVVKYLCNNSTQFPLYNITNDDITPSGKIRYESDLYFSEGVCGCLACKSNYDFGCGCNYN